MLFCGSAASENAAHFSVAPEIVWEHTHSSGLPKISWYVILDMCQVHHHCLKQIYGEIVSLASSRFVLRHF